jgi:uncharacterized protein involved in exopolysaccharide biosynthesis
MSREIAQAIAVFEQRLGNQHPNTINARSWLEGVRKEMETSIDE